MEEEKTMENLNVKVTIANNLKEFIESTGRSYAWIISRTDIPETTFYKLLNGEGDLEKHIEKIIKVFGIEDPFYFHNINFVPPNHVESDLTTLAAANYDAIGDEQEEFKETMIMLNDFINMIEILKRNTTSGTIRMIIKE